MIKKLLPSQTNEEVDMFLMKVIRVIKPRVLKTNVIQKSLENQYHTKFRNYGVVVSFISQTDRCQTFLEKHPVLLYIQLYTYSTLSVIVFTARHAVVAALMCLIRVYFQDTKYPYSQTRLLLIVTTIQYQQYMYVDEEEYQQDVLKQRSEEETYYLDKIDMYKFDKKEKEDKIKNGTYQKGQLDHDDDDCVQKLLRPRGTTFCAMLQYQSLL